MYIASSSASTATPLPSFVVHPQAPFPLPPLSAYNGVRIYARTGGLLVFFPCDDARRTVLRAWDWTRSRCGGTWLNPAFPEHQIFCSYYPSGIHILQRFDRRPEIAMAVRVGRALLGENARPLGAVALPLRFRIPVSGGSMFSVPAGTVRSRPVNELPTFKYTHSGVSYDVRVTSRRRDGGPLRLSLDAFVGGEHTTNAGDLRRYIYTADVRRLAGLDRAELPGFVSDLLTAMMSVLDNHARWNALAPDTGRDLNLLRIADVQASHGDLSFRVRLPDPSGHLVFNAPIPRHQKWISLRSSVHLPPLNLAQL